jgi:hypothetical protein
MLITAVGSQKIVEILQHISSASLNLTYKHVVIHILFRSCLDAMNRHVRPNPYSQSEMPTGISALEINLRIVETWLSCTELSRMNEIVTRLYDYILKEVSTYAAHT